MANDKSTYFVGGHHGGPDHNQPARFFIGRRDAYQAAMAQGDPCAIWKRDRAGHWELIVDRSVPSACRLPLAAHLRNVLGVVELRQMAREVSTGKPGYRWVSGYLVPTNAGHEYPPISRSQAYARARELYGDDCVIVL